MSMIFRTSEYDQNAAGCAPPARGNRAFTVVELLTASVVMAIALLGVYALLQQGLARESGFSAAWNNRSAARAVVDHLARTLERSVDLPQGDGPSGLVGDRGDGGRPASLTCWSAHPQGRLRRLRYRWGFDDGDERDLTRRGRVEVQVLDYSGTTNITPVAGSGPMDETTWWARVEPNVIGSRIDTLAISFRSVADPDANWQDQWNGPVGRLKIRVRATVADQTVERIVLTRVNSEVTG